jgi:hypothetical protein
VAPFLLLEWVIVAGIGLILAVYRTTVRNQTKLNFAYEKPHMLPAGPSHVFFDHNVRMDFAFMSLSFISASQLNSILLRNLAVSK